MYVQTNISITDGIHQTVQGYVINRL